MVGVAMKIEVSEEAGVFIGLLGGIYGELFDINPENINVVEVLVGEEGRLLHLGKRFSEE